MAQTQTEGVTIVFEGRTVQFDRSVDGMKKALDLLKRETKMWKKEFEATGDLSAINKQFKSLLKQQTAARIQYGLIIDDIERLANKGSERSEKEEKEYKARLKQYAVMRTQLRKIAENIKICEDAINDFNEADLDKLIEKLDEISDQFEKISDITGEVGGFLKPFSDAATKGLKQSADSAIEFQSSFADVLKTVNDASPEQFGELRDGLLEMSKTVPTTASDLAKIMGLAGQMNVPAEQLLDFTKKMVDFGNATNITAEEATQDIAQIYNVIGRGGDFSDLDNLLSTIVDLGNNTATTEKDIVEMFRNIASASSGVGMTESQMAALAATLSSLGLDKGGASSISRIMTNINMAVDTNSEKLKEWASVAGMSAKKFSKVWKDDAASGLLAVVEGIARSKEEGTSFGETLEDLGIKELRQVDTITRLSNANKDYANNIRLADAAYEEHTALTEEAAKRYETVQSKIQILKNTFQAFAISIGDIMLPIIEKVIAGVSKISEWLNNLSPQAKQMIAILMGIIASLAPLLLGINKISGVLGKFTGGTLKDLLTNNKNILAVGKQIGTWLQGFLSSPVALLIAALVALYIGSEDFRNSVNSLVQTLVGLFKPAIELVWNVLQLLWEILGDVIDFIMVMWEDFAKSEYAQRFIQILQDIISWIQTVLGWIGQLINMISSAVSWFRNLLGAAREASGISVGGRATMTGNGMNVINSGGYGSGGIVMNPVFNVTTSAVTREDVRSWARWIADDVNEELGRRIR